MQAAMSDRKGFCPVPNHALWRCLLCLIVVCGGMEMSGCASGIIVRPVAAAVGSPTGSTATSPTATTSTTTEVPKSSGVSTSGFASVTNFGDSITCGYYATPNDGAGYMYSTQGYATLLDAGLDMAAKDLCRGGDQAADMARLWVYPNAMPKGDGAQLYTVLIGTNDAHFCGPSPGCMGAWSSALTASLAWLAVPLEDKVLGSGMAASGGWAADLEYGVATSGAGKTLRFTVQQAVAGRSMYVAYRVFDPSAQAGGVATVTVDGEQVAVLDASQTMKTQNGTTDTIWVAQIPLGAAGSHRVTITTGATETGAGAFFSVLWAGVPSQNYATVSGAPTVVVGSVTTTGSDQLNGWVSQYNGALTALVATVTGNGLNVTIAPTGTALAESDLVDLLHPGNAGHAKLAAAFASVLPQSAP